MRQPVLSLRQLGILLGLIYGMGLGLTYHFGQLGCLACDPSSYLGMGQSYIDQGLLANTDAAKGRLYGFPLAVSSFIRLATLTSIDLNFLIFITQSLLYLGLTIWLTRLLTATVSSHAGKIALAALLLNGLAYPYLTIPLTDGFSLLLEIAIIGVLAELFLRPRLAQSPALLLLFTLLLGGLYGYAVMVRPANIQLAGFIVPGLAIIHFRQPVRDWRRLLAMGAGTGAGFAAAVAPQLWFNWHYYQQFTFMPVGGLGTYQLLAGRNLLKYATSFLKGGTSVDYTSPWAKLGHPARSDLAWYFVNPGYGIATIAAHIFAGIDFDYYYAYNKLHRSPSEFWTVLASQSAVYWGVAGWGLACIHFQRTRRATGWSPETWRWLFPLAISLAIVVGWCAIYALSAVESRFGLPLIALAMPWALWALTLPRTTQAHNRLWLGFAAYFAIAWYCNNLLNALNRLPYA